MFNKNSLNNETDHNNQIKATSSISSSKNETNDILSNNLLSNNSYSSDMDNEIGVGSEFNNLSDYEFDEDEDEDGDIDEDDDEEEDEEDNNDQPGSLDVIIQFNTDVICEHDITIDYINTMKDNCALIHVPARTNHMCLVYKKKQHSRLHSYINHYCDGYFYNLICTYYE